MYVQVERLTAGDIPAWLALAEEVRDLFGADMVGDPAFLDWVMIYE